MGKIRTKTMKVPWWWGGTWPGKEHLVAYLGSQAADARRRGDLASAEQLEHHAEALGGPVAC